MLLAWYKYLSLCPTHTLFFCLNLLLLFIIDINSTTIYKAGLNTLDDLYNLGTKIITRYPVLATFKILKIIKKTSPIFYNFENFESC